jgi:uncharacterized membrane protein
VSRGAAARTAARNAVAGLVGLLCALFVIWHVARYGAATAAVACAIGVLPWVAVLPGLWRGDRQRHIVATLLTAPYLGYGLMEVLANPGARLYAGALVLVAFATFVALLASLRLSRPATAAPT